MEARRFVSMDSGLFEKVLAEVEKLPGGLLPTVVFENEVAGGGGHAGALLRVLDEPGDFFGELFRCLGDEEMSAVLHRQAFDADGGGDDGESRSHGLKDLDACAATDAQGEDHDGGPGEVGADVIDGSGDGDAVVSGGEVADGEVGVPTDDEEMRGGGVPKNGGPGFAMEFEYGVDVGAPVHGTEERDGGRF